MEISPLLTWNSRESSLHGKHMEKEFLASVNGMEDSLGESTSSHLIFVCELIKGNLGPVSDDLVQKAKSRPWQCNTLSLALGHRDDISISLIIHLSSGGTVTTGTVNELKAHSHYRLYHPDHHSSPASSKNLGFPTYQLSELLQIRACGSSGRARLDGGEDGDDEQEET
jgi:hypothetical protein